MKNILKKLINRKEELEFCLVHDADINSVDITKDIQAELKELNEVIAFIEKKTVKQIILSRIEELREKTNNFNRNTMRWRSPLSHGAITKYADEIDYASLDNTELVFLFERILRRANQLM